MTEGSDESPAALRIDRWLWFARLARSRTLAQRLVKSGKVRLNRQKIATSSQMLKCGDILTLSLPQGVRVLEVIAMADRRGPFSQARELYRDLSPPAQSSPDDPVSIGRPDSRKRREARSLRGRWQ
ncbi:MAG: RNA-binding S4 domain-containing protein [Rhizobiaceae bacterium]